MMIMLKGFYCFHNVLLLLLLLSPQVYSSKANGNPAKTIANIINNNRTSLKLPTLYDNPGLGCMALQYAEECNANCTSNNTVTCQPLADDFTEVFGPDCGVELPTFADISGHILGCSSKYLQPTEAFSEILVRDKKSLTLLQNKTHTQVGVGVVSTHNGHFFWCVLFSNTQVKSSFVLEDHGLGIQQKEGCFSGTNTTCNGAKRGKDASIFCSFSVLFASLLLFWLM